MIEFRVKAKGKGKEWSRWRLANECSAWVRQVKNMLDGEGEHVTLHYSRVKIQYRAVSDRGA